VGHFLGELRDVDGFVLVFETQLESLNFIEERIVRELVEIGCFAVNSTRCFCCHGAEVVIDFYLVEWFCRGVEVREALLDALQCRCSFLVLIGVDCLGGDK
jgi:hypothetical protein